MFPAGLEPATFRVWAGRDNHYTYNGNGVVILTVVKLTVNEHDWAVLWLVDWLLRIRAWQIFRWLDL